MPNVPVILECLNASGDLLPFGSVVDVQPGQDNSVGKAGDTGKLNGPIGVTTGAVLGGTPGGTRVQVVQQGFAMVRLSAAVEGNVVAGQRLYVNNAQPGTATNVLNDAFPFPFATALSVTTDPALVLAAIGSVDTGGNYVLTGWGVVTANTGPLTLVPSTGELVSTGPGSRVPPCQLVQQYYTIHKTVGPATLVRILLELVNTNGSVFQSIMTAVNLGAGAVTIADCRDVGTNGLIFENAVPRCLRVSATFDDAVTASVSVAVVAALT